MKTFKEFIYDQRELTLQEYLAKEETHHSYDDIVELAGYIGSPIASVLLFGAWYIFKLENGLFYVEYDRTDIQCESLLEAQLYFWNGFAKWELDIDFDDKREDLHSQCQLWISTQGKGVVGISEFAVLAEITEPQRAFAQYLNNEFKIIDEYEDK